MSSLNKVIIMGNLTRDPEYRQLGSGQSICKLGLASNRQYKNRQTGDMVQEVCFVDVDVWGPQADSCNEYLQKGRPVLVEGRLKFDSWKDQEGQTRSKHTVVADRVVFLYGSQDDVQTNSKDSEPEVDEEILKKLNEIKKNKSAQEKSSKPEDKKVVSAVKSKTKSDTNDEYTSDNEIDFQDEPPFEDDLPF